MGRVAAKRKLKSCDPFFKGTRSNGKKAKAFDLPPTESKRSKKRNRKALDEHNVEQFVLRSSTGGGGANLNGSIGGAGGVTKHQKLQVSAIKEGESMREFNKRISTEVKRVIYDDTRKNRRSTEKRKAYLSKKKDKAKEKKMTEQELYEREFQASGSTKKDFFEDKDDVRFGERVDAPPILPKLKGIFKKRADAIEKQKNQKSGSVKVQKSNVKVQKVNVKVQGGKKNGRK